MAIKTCEECGTTRNTNGAALLCRSCETVRRKELSSKQWITSLTENGYDPIDLHRFDKGSHTTVTVKNLECQHTFTAKLNNILSRKTVCSVCGPKKRMAQALKHYIAKYGRTYDLREWRDYRDYVYELSNKVYENNKTFYNPLGMPRTRLELHPNAVNLDHIIPIIYGFKNGLNPKLLAHPQNLRIVPAKKNLSKRQAITEETSKLLPLLSLAKDQLHNPVANE